MRLVRRFRLVLFLAVVKMGYSDEALIAEVEKYRELYDTFHRWYYDTKQKDDAWQEIGDSLNLPAETCKAKWRALRENYRKSKQRRRTVNGQEPKCQKPWKYEREMSFLDRGKDSRDHEEDSDDGDSSVIDDTPTTKCEDAYPVNSQSGSSSAPFAMRQNKQTTTGAEMLQDYYLDQKEENRCTRESYHPTNDHIRQFFASSEAIFRMLPAEEQVDARVEITQLLAKYEKKVLLKRPPPEQKHLVLSRNSASVDEHHLQFQPIDGYCTVQHSLQ